MGGVMRYWGLAVVCLGLFGSTTLTQAQAPASSAASSLDADFRRADSLQHGFGGVTRDVAAAVRLYRQTADAGHVGAMNALGKLLLDGDQKAQIAKDHRLALQYFRRAADRGHWEATRYVAVFTGAGLAGIRQDFDAASRMLDAADRKFPDTAGQRFRFSRTIADHTSQGTMVERTSAAMWRLMAIEQASQFGPGTLGSTSMGGEINLLTFRLTQNYPDHFDELVVLFPDMFRIFSKIAERPDIRNNPRDSTSRDVHFLLHHFYLNGLGGAPRDPARGVNYLRLAADNGHGTSSHLLAQYHIDAKHGLTRNVPEILRLLNRAIAQGNRQADYTLGRYHHDGWGKTTRGDRSLAFQHFQRAAEINMPEALEWTGTYLYEGLYGTPRDERRAISYYRRAADRGRALPAMAVGLAYGQGTHGLSRNRTAACNHFSKSIQQQHPLIGHAYYLLGTCYEAGEGVGRDLNEARRLYRRAIGTGSPHPNAERALARLGG